jgi:putative oxidoreductase
VGAEAIGAALVVLGLFARLSALACAVTMGVAFFLVHQSVLSGEKSGEMAFVYLGAFVVIFLAGPGRFSLDALIGRGNGVR